ncbi:MAG: hypothetical protein GX053_00765 [Tissierella sp.]|nr:hypothetical protein [Tissierella sp.]
MRNLDKKRDCEVICLNYTFSLCEIFYNMSLEQYNLYKSNKKELDDICKGNYYFDVLSHAPEENIAFHSCYNKAYSAAISSIVFQAFAIEAFINFYGSIKLGHHVFHDHYDRISIRDKIIIISKIATGKDFPKGEKVYELINKVIRQRDKLVHHKGKEIRFEDCSEEQFHKTMHMNIDFIFDDIDDLVKTYPLFIKTIAILEGKEIDAYNEQQLNLTNEFLRVIKNTIHKAFLGPEEETD